MALTIGVLVYLVFCLLTGLCGSQRRVGFLGTFVISLFITPVVMLIVLLLTGPSRESSGAGAHRAIECSRSWNAPRFFFLSGGIGATPSA